MSSANIDRESGSKTRMCLFTGNIQPLQRSDPERIRRKLTKYILHAKFGTKKDVGTKPAAVPVPPISGDG